MRLRKVLVVDDEADIRLIAEISLSSLGGWIDPMTLPDETHRIPAP